MHFYHRLPRFYHEFTIKKWLVPFHHFLKAERKIDFKNTIDNIVKQNQSQKK